MAHRFLRYGTDPVFEWDPLKAAGNLRKHGVDFSEATLVFSDPNAIFEEGGDVDGEQRLQILGIVGGRKLLVVVFVTHESDDVEVIRLISARSAERQERRSYEKKNGPLPN